MQIFSPNSFDNAELRIKGRYRVSGILGREEKIATDLIYPGFMLGLAVVLLVKHKTLILYSYFHGTFMFLLLVSVTFYRCIEKKA